MKESVPKMSGRIYKGERYSFTRYEKRLGKGGNGAVYDVKLEKNEVIKFPVVASNERIIITCNKEETVSF